MLQVKTGSAWTETYARCRAAAPEVERAVDDLAEHRDLLALLLVWEIERQVDGRANARKIAPALDSMARVGQRHILETEGLNTWGIWDYTQWDGLAQHLRKGFEYGKQRCTAYPRYVVQRSPFPVLDFGPLINAAKVAELDAAFEEAVALGGVPLLRGQRRPAVRQPCHRGAAGIQDRCEHAALAWVATCWSTRSPSRAVPRQACPRLQAPKGGEVCT